MKLIYFILGNISFIIFLFLFATDKDLSGLSKDPFERFVGIVYYVSTVVTTTGYGDIVATSTRARIVIILYMICMFSILVLNFFPIKYKS